MASVTETLVIGPADHGRHLTLEEFEDADFEEGYRYELARGVLEVSFIAEVPHRLIVWFLLGLLRDYERAHPGRILYAGGGSEFRLVLPEMVSGRHPDVGVAIRGTPLQDPRGPRPSLCIEVVSKGSEAHHRDYVAKREEYLAYGLLEYWIVDRFTRRVLVLVRDGDRWTERIFAESQTASGLVLPGFAVPLADLWAVVDAEADKTDDEPEA